MRKKKPIPLKRKKQPEPTYVVVVNCFDEDDREAMQAWNEMWRMLLAPLIHPIEQSEAA
jgi:hypothetical protein